MNDDDPLDLTQVAADAEALDALTAGRRTGDTPGDPALAALHELLRDVDRDLPEEVPLVPGLGSSVRAVSGDRPGPRPRVLVRKSSTVALLAAGMISVGGVAAASSAAPHGSPLHDLREAVRSAAGAVITAVTPPEPRPSPEARPSPASVVAPAATTPGAAVSTVARSAAAARQVTALLDAAQALLADRRHAAAEQRLDTAERHLADVLPADGKAGLTSRLAALRAQLADATAHPDEPRGSKPTTTPTEKPAGKPGEKAGKPAGKPTAKPAGRTSEPPNKQPAPAPDRKAEPTEPAGEGDDPEDEPTPRETSGAGEEPPGQLSKDASAKPRA